jgi:transmembrane sensor
MSDMADDEEPVHRLIAQEAADWFVANRAGLNARERQNFAAWLKASPLNVEEYLAFSVIARDLREVCRDSPVSLEELLARARAGEADRVSPLWPRLAGGVTGGLSRGWRMAAACLVGCAIVGAGLLAVQRFGPMVSSPAPVPLTILRFHTGPGEQATRRLPDDSVVHLNSDSVVTVRFSNQERRVELTSGEADFEVAHAPGRAFKVAAGVAETIAVGTHFDVRLEGVSTVVTVLEGRVIVAPAARPAGSAALPEIPLGANEQVSVAAGAWPDKPVAVDAQRSTAWLHRQITFDHEPLEQVAGEFNRYSSKPIEIATPALRKLEISGQFTADDTEAFVAFLRSLQHVRVEVTATRIIVSQN